MYIYLVIFQFLKAYCLSTMPALTANSVTLEEVLEVRGGPLHDNELWAILSLASEALQDIFLGGE